jgi:polyketide biosynthesis enoyl-CoA hydratase PksH
MSVELRQLGTIWRARLTQPEINVALVAALRDAVERCETAAGTVLVLEGTADTFCIGGDLQATTDRVPYDPAPLYDLWQRLSNGPFVSVAVVRGRATAGGVGLAACCDIVLADNTASFSLSELLFGLHPACVMPFLTRRVGAQKAHYLTLTTTAIGAAEALSCGLADAIDGDAEALLRTHLVRLRRLSCDAIARYKSHRATQDDSIARARDAALEANRAMFADPIVRQNIRRYLTEAKFPWE